VVFEPFWRVTARVPSDVPVSYRDVLSIPATENWLIDRLHANIPINNSQTREPLPIDASEFVAVCIEFDGEIRSRYRVD
jgi:hypothetical protein